MRKSTIVTGAFVAAMAAAPAGAQEYFKGKQVSLMVGYGAGGGYDTTARIVARHLGKHIPGNPTVVVQNMPGAGSMKLVNFLYNAAPKSGAVIGLFSASAALQPLLGNKRAKFETDKFNWIASLHTDIQACGVWKGAGQNIRTLDDLIAAKETVVFGSTSPASPTSQFPLFVKNRLGAKIKVIQGYKGTRGINLAMKKGEVHGTCGMFESSVKGAFLQDFQSGDLVLFMQVGLDSKVPFFGDATPVSSKLQTEEDRQIAELVFRPAEITRPVAAPPGVPMDRVAALRKAVADTMKDPALRSDGKKIRVDFQPKSGDEVARLFRSFNSTPKAVVEKAVKIMTTP